VRQEKGADVKVFEGLGLLSGKVFRIGQQPGNCMQGLAAYQIQPPFQFVPHLCRGLNHELFYVGSILLRQRSQNIGLHRYLTPAHKF
jgi:hypothetical protein